MFTGLITDVGTIDRVRDGAPGRELRVRTSYGALVAGESIALNGVCLTVREFGDGAGATGGDHWFTVAAVTATLERTTVERWAVGTRVNLERAVRVGDPLGGHLVQGHVDGVARVAAVIEQPDGRRIEIALPAELAELVVLHGSIAVDGVSLTVSDLRAGGSMTLALIDYTLRHTTLGELAVGSVVNLETDVIGKYVQRLASPYVEAAGR